MVDLVLEPLKFLESDVAKVGRDDIDPTCDGLEVVEGGERAVSVVVEAIRSSNGDLGWVG